MWVFIFLDSKENFGNNLSGFAEIFTFSSPAPIVSALADIARYATSSCVNVYDVI